MNPRALAILALADRGIPPKVNEKASAAHRAMMMDCLPYFRQRLDAEMSEKAMYEARAQDVSLSERDRQYALGRVQAMEWVDMDISAYEKGETPTMMLDIDHETTSPFVLMFAARLMQPPPPSSPYYKRRSVKAYLPYWRDDEWMGDDAIGNRHYELWLKRGKKNHVNRPA